MRNIIIVSVAMGIVAAASFILSITDCEHYFKLYGGIICIIASIGTYICGEILLYRYFEDISAKRNDDDVEFWKILKTIAKE